MPTDMPAVRNTPAKARKLRRRLDQIQEELDALIAERTAITRELAGLWVELDVAESLGSRKTTPGNKSGNEAAKSGRASKTSPRTSGTRGSATSKKKSGPGGGKNGSSRKSKPKRAS